jgi:hypothetical protein
MKFANYSEQLVLGNNATRRSGISGDATRHHQRTTALAQEKPEPKAVMETSLPGWSAPSRTASSSSIGIEAAEQLP